ncbi:transcriptional regulator [Paenirhodobacter enshiensis]|uniref:Regulatory protein VirG n=1 Tax=Paenirhodobacter enshiensis TaxID=1105367 RepID=A0A086XR06_9RHOB|nr:transcriptional regulator [Paenirhodobacter enshiensis]
MSSPLPPPRALVALVEDDAELRSLTAALLGEEGFEVIELADGRALDACLRSRTPQVLLLDVMLPGEDGLSICRRLAPDSPFRILMLTARGTDIDRILGLELGADDYLPKPFNPRELVARIRALLRRTSAPVDPRREAVRFLNWSLDLSARALTDTTTGQEIALSSGEFDLLAQFVAAPGRVLSRDHLLDVTRGRTAGPFDRAIDVQVSKLRRKLHDDADSAHIIKTVRNGGYVFVPTVERGVR